MTPAQRKQQLRQWAVQTIFFALHEKNRPGVDEQVEQLGIRASTLADRFLSEAEAESGGKVGQMTGLVPPRVFDWVESHRRGS
jgi:hypothetical protein